MTTPEPTKIMTVCLDDKKKFRCYAAYNGEILFIFRVLPCNDNSSLLSEIVDKKQQGFVILIEERTEHIVRQSGIDVCSFSFEARSPEGKINLYTALDYYFSMTAQGNSRDKSLIQISPDYQNFYITDSAVDLENDEKGRNKYRVNWQVFNGGHKAILMAVMASIFPPITQYALKQMLGYDKDDGLSDPLIRMQKTIMNNLVLPKVEEFEGSFET